MRVSQGPGGLSAADPVGSARRITCGDLRRSGSARALRSADSPAVTLRPSVVSPLVPAPRSALDPRVADALSAVSADALVAELQDLLAVPSVTGTAAESEAQHRVEARLRAVGMDTDLWSIDLPTTTADPEFPGSEAPRDEAWGLVGAWGGDDGPTVVLNGHIDVVPPGEVGWSAGPWSGAVRGDRVVGRGACDMKAGLACQLLAVQALRQAGVDLRGKVVLQSVVGEEDGGLGTFATLRRGHTGDLAVICEPTGGRLVTATAGALTFRLVVHGRSVHASARLDGVDAFEKYVLVHTALRRLEERRNRDPHPLMAGYRLPYPLSVGTVSSGDWASTVADRLVAEGRLGVAPGRGRRRRPRRARARRRRGLRRRPVAGPEPGAGPVVGWPVRAGRGRRHRPGHPAGRGGPRRRARPTARGAWARRTARTSGC